MFNNARTMQFQKKIWQGVIISLFHDKVSRYSKQCSCSAEVMMDYHSKRLANIKPALVQPPVIIKTYIIIKYVGMSYLYPPSD